MPGSDNGPCGTCGYAFWWRDRNARPGDAVEGAGPPATPEPGRGDILWLKSESASRHPIHLDGLVFKLLRLKQRLPPGDYLDTTLLRKQQGRGYCSEGGQFGRPGVSL